MEIWCVGTPVDWKTTREVLTIVLGVVGFFAWRRQIRGKSRHDIAQALLREALKVQEAIANVRRPGAIYARAATEPGQKPNPERERLKGQQFAYERRLNRMHDARADLRLAAINAETFWRGQALARIGDLEQCVREIHVDVEEYFTFQNRKLDGETVDSVQEREIRARVFDRSGVRRPDAFAQQVEAAVAKVENLVRPELDGLVRTCVRAIARRVRDKPATE